VRSILSAATALATGQPLYTGNPGGFAGLSNVIEIVSV
jgi:hypothetical protein